MDKSADLTASLYKKFGQRVRQNRLLKNLNQSELAQRVGLSRTSITNIERGEQRVLLHHLYALAESLSIAPMELLPPSHELSDEHEAVTLPNELSAEEKGWVKRIIELDQEENHQP
jgi:transcriptional regulator with XRE-family HTH domain